MIQDAQSAHPEVSVRRLCERHRVSRSWFYEQQGQEEPDADQALVGDIEAVVQEFVGYGYRRVTRELARRGRPANHKRVLNAACCAALGAATEPPQTPSTTRSALERTLPVEGGLGLKNPEQNFGLAAVMSETLFQALGERVNMRAGGTGTDHTPFCRPLLFPFASWTPFPSTCQGLSGTEPMTTSATRCTVPLPRWGRRMFSCSAKVGTSGRAACWGRHDPECCSRHS
ncbi:IS3 family transposase [Deinococcus sp. MIMF12]|uniref:IS3 family transposase n=1 Tax=Deinococcus rhizophilus TaxID=3049544 RepID=A0ABT7JEY1_9DEIO|nr:IS3 family transposase [Deinococcus rhizophilus]MDL2343612.1 IS3 family transposase [Deinococcus rhizophilus]